MKKLLSLFIIFCFIISCGAVSAENEVLEAEMETFDASEMLSELGIMKGDENGDLNAEKEVTRAELSALMLRITKENSEKKASSFCDVENSHWAVSYIESMAEKGILEGYPDGSFKPEKSVTLSECVKILLGVLNEADDCLSYPYDYLLKGASVGLTKGINVNPESALTREMVAKLIINALYIPVKNGEMMIKKADVPTFYVSNEGKDSGDGSFKNPWKTLAEATKNVSGHAIIYVSDGIYEESETTKVNGGKNENAPLIIRAKLGEKVEIVYKDLEEKLIVPENSDFVTIKNLSFKSDSENEEENILKSFGNNFTFKNNKLSGMELMIENAENSLIEENVFEDGKVAVLLNGASKTTVKGNKFSAQTETMLSIANSENTGVYSNTFDVSGNSEVTAISIGTEDSQIVKNCAMVNNVIYNGKKTLAKTAVVLSGTENFLFYNNIVDSVNGAICFKENNTGSDLKNNIYLNCSDRAYIMNEATKLSSDFNCFYQTYPEINEKNSIYQDPYIVSRGGDWHLMSDSPAVLKGTEVKTEIKDSDGKIFAIDFKDFEGAVRESNPNMGIYAKTSNESLLANSDGIDAENLLLYYDFKTAPDRLVASGGDWGASGGVYRQGDTDGARTTVCYDGGLEWTNFEFSADVEAPNSTEGHASGIIFRSDLEMKNMYTFRFLTYDTLEFAKWQNNSFASIEKWEFPFEMDGTYNLKVRAVGSNFIFYVNGEKVREVQDNSYLSGTVGLYCYRETNVYDNMKVEKVN